MTRSEVRRRAVARGPRSYSRTLYVVWDVSPSFMTKDAPFPHFKPLNRIRHNCQTVRILFSVRTCPLNILADHSFYSSLAGKVGNLAQGAVVTKSRHLPSLYCTFAHFVGYAQRPEAFSLQIGDMDHSIDIFGCKGDLLAKLSDKEKCV
jgi:hypothetical protein